MDSKKMAAWESKLCDFDRDIRFKALEDLATIAKAGQIPFAPESDVVNMHCHTFFSFNAYGYSPAALAWLAKQRGYNLLGIVDFDVLDGVDEYLTACDTLGVRGTAGLETRVFLPEFSTREINSPGEPGVCYSMGIGFTSSGESGEAADSLSDIRHRAELRNREMLARLNAYLDPVTVDYGKDVQKLTPSGNATERHIIQAYLTAVQAEQSDPVAFWAKKLNLAPEQVAKQMPDSPAFQNLVRSKLMKRGGAGYIHQDPIPSRR